MTAVKLLGSILLLPNELHRPLRPWHYLGVVLFADLVVYIFQNVRSYAYPNKGPPLRQKLFQISQTRRVLGL